MDRRQRGARAGVLGTWTEVMDGWGSASGEQSLCPYGPVAVAGGDGAMAHRTPAVLWPATRPCHHPHMLSLINLHTRSRKRATNCHPPLTRAISAVLKICLKKINRLIDTYSTYIHRFITSLFSVWANSLYLSRGQRVLHQFDAAACSGLI